MKTFRIVEVQPHAFLTSILDVGEWSASRRAGFIHGDPRSPLGRRLCGPEIRSRRGDKEKNSCPSRESNPGRPFRSLVSLLTESVLNLL
jgi:hypothetical protein